MKGWTENAQALVGATIDRRFRIDRVIGPGENGAIVLGAHETTTGNPVAIRCPGIPEELAGRDYDDALEGFLREAEELSKACATGNDVEQLLSFGVAEPPTLTHARERLPFCVFEWLEGKSLEQHIDERAGRAQSITEAIALLEPAARGLAAAHAVGVAHKDVRPRNLWLSYADGRMRVKLTQFVLASRIGPADDAFDPQYGAPEHFKSSYGSVGTYSDVYGLALCFIELVSGRRALDGAEETDLYLATSNLALRPTLRARGVEVSEAVEAVLVRALAVEPRRRWQTAQEFWDALVAAVPELTPGAPSVRPRVGRSVVVEVEKDESENENEHERDERRDERRDSNVLPWVLFVVALAGAIAIVATKLHRPASRTPTVLTAPVAAPSPPPRASAENEPAVGVRPFMVGTDRDGSDRDE